MTNTQTDSGDELDVFGREFLDCAGRFKEMVQSTETKFPDISGADMWEKLYYAGVLPDIIRFIILEGRAREREAELRGKISVLEHYDSIAPNEVPARLADMHNALRQLQPNPQAGDGGEGI